MTEPFLRPVPLPEVQLAFPLSHPIGQFPNSIPLELHSDDEMQFNYERNRARMRAKEKLRKQKLAIEKLTKATIEKLEQQQQHQQQQQQQQSNSNSNSKSNLKKSSTENSLEPMSPSGSTASELSMNQEEMKNETERQQEKQLSLAQHHQEHQQQQQPTRRNHLTSPYDLADSRYIETMPPDPPKKPVDIKRKTIPMPNGQVTYITEMLYDIEDTDTGHGGNHHFKATRPPTVAQFLPPTSDDMFPPTENPRQINSHSTSSLPPSTTVPSFTLPTATMTSTSTQRSTDRRSTESWASLPTPPPPYKMTTLKSMTSRGTTDAGLDLTTSGHRRELSTTSTITSRSLRTSASDLPRFRQLDEEAHPSRRLNVTKPTGHRKRFRPDASDSLDKTWRSETDGLGAAAIAGIVIGSLVSITLLAGE